MLLRLVPRADGKTYRSFSEAERRSPATYASGRLALFRIERAKLNMQAVSALHLPPAYALLLLAGHISRAAEPHIVDFGGACGEWGYALKKNLTRPFRYTVVENADLARRCADDPFFGWFRCAQELPASFDIFLSSGTLQYIEDPYKILESAFAHAGEAVVLGRNSFCERDLFRVHESKLGSNGFGDALPPGFDPDEDVSYPHRTISFSRIVKMAAEAGWTLKLQMDSQSGVLPYRGEVSGRDLMFTRSGSAAS